VNCCSISERVCSVGEAKVEAKVEAEVEVEVEVEVEAEVEAKVEAEVEAEVEVKWLGCGWEGEGGGKRRAIVSLRSPTMP
jgi:hypothetical protein